MPSLILPCINLLPWRIERRRSHRRRFVFALVMSTTLALFAIVALHAVLATELNQQSKDIQALEQTIQDLEQTSGALLSTTEQSWLQEWQQKRQAAQKIMGLLHERTPDGVALITFKQQDTEHTLSGLAVSNKALTDFQQALIDSGYWQQVTLINQSASLSDRRRVLSFTLSTRIALTDQQSVTEK